MLEIDVFFVKHCFFITNIFYTKRKSLFGSYLVKCNLDYLLTVADR